MRGVGMVIAIAGRRLTFAPRLVPTLATIGFVALTIALGRWQLHRAEEKEQRQAMFEARLREAPVRLTGDVDSPAPLLYRHVAVAGTWVPERQIFIDNQVEKERAGFYVMTPLRIRGSDAVVLVNRGWIARTAAYPRAPSVPTVAGEVEVTGIATVPPARFLELSSQTVAGDVWQNLSIDRYRRWSGMKVLPVEVLADAPAPGLVAVREQPDAGAQRHREYEYQWFLFAATAVTLWIALNLRRVP